MRLHDGPAASASRAVEVPPITSFKDVDVNCSSATPAAVNHAELMSDDYLFKSRNRLSSHISKKQYARGVNVWMRGIGLDPAEYGTHSLRRTKASLIYRRTKNLRAVQILLGHRKMESTVRYMGIEVNDALEMSEQTEF